MNSTLQELTDKIYNEGVVKGQNEAAEILSQAKNEAAEIIENAQVEAKRTKEVAEKEASTLKENTEKEIKLFANQAVNALKSEITNLICNKIAADSVKTATADKIFMQDIIKGITQSWLQNGNVTIETSNAKDLNEYFQANAKDLLEKGLEIKEVKGLKTSFAITPTNGSYKITIGEEEFIEYFKEFLRPQLKDLLF